MDVVFLDANVLFSAAYRPDAKFLKLWRMKDVRLVSSLYAADEARRNLSDGEQRDRLESLLRDVELGSGIAEGALPEGVRLPAKDVPILKGAIAARATHLITGDVTHFGPYFDRTICGVRVVSPAGYLKARPL